ncbi:TRAP transporter small permease [Rhodopirellula sallentina]|uniref:Tripartite ATP-independent periplasmic transporter, DctQ component n=1 Tax=Rhodopirellula sallentina SM41 TaxID=1263870 RepID=M5UAZ5_9BACT|nr:TRAP transporter small permease [Rhodopirellula sallentina]EMI58474.1 Tripartite ATP-independent periplasmic transporter, DctQ component [Rhodopirellula sallentina SM41]
MHQHIKRIVQGLTKVLQWLLIAAMALLVLDVVWGVMTRYIGGEQASWTEELARFLLIWVALLGGAVAFDTKSHLGVDYFVGKFETGVRKSLRIFTHFVVLFFAITIFVIGGARVVYDALVLDQTTPALGWKMGHVYLVIPIAGCFMALFTIAHLIETFSGDDEAPQKAD